MAKQKNHVEPIATTAKRVAPKRKTPEAVPEVSAEITSAPDLLLSADIRAISPTETAAAEGLDKTNAYAIKRLGELSQKDIQAKTLILRQEARKRGYKLEQLIHNIDALKNALDDFDLTCFNLGLYPIQNLLAVWLNTTNAQLFALSTAANVSEAGELIAVHSDYCISVISSAAMQSDKPPVFSIYYLKSAYKMFDVPTNGGVMGFNAVGITQNITINAADISKKSQLFGEIDAEETPEK